MRLQDLPAPGRDLAILGLIAAVATAGAAAGLDLVLAHGLALVAFATALVCRGWTPGCLGLEPSWAATLEGGLVAGAALAISGALYVGARHTWPGLDLGEWPQYASLGPLRVLAGATVLALAEELLVTGWMMTRLAPRFGLALAAHASVALRILLHAHAGLEAIVLMLPFGLVVASWYAGTRRLWPAVVANALVAWLVGTTHH